MSDHYFSENSEAMVQLEAMVDATSLADVLAALATIACGKAEHLRSNWQDKVSARVWNRAAGKIDRAVAQVEV